MSLLSETDAVDILSSLYFSFYRFVKKIVFMESLRKPITSILSEL